ncbi:MAG TPA: hypothetical protein VKA26_10400 [Ignavibacteriaceae bacterium]|nr:hypothetical protein [Ignavibacteriaceae bacterium]
MPKNSNKYRVGLFFLTAYLLFVLVGTFHYHTYDLNPLNNFNTKTNNSYTDLNSDFFSVCSLHQFSQTITSSFYASSDIIQTLVKLQTISIRINFNTHDSDILSNTPPRAPPIFS